MSRLGGRAAGSRRSSSSRSLAPASRSSALAAAQLGVQRDERALREVAVEVGDEPDRVRQRDAVLERGAALVVDEQEREPVGRVRRRPARR